MASTFVISSAAMHLLETMIFLASLPMKSYFTYPGFTKLSSFIPKKCSNSIDARTFELYSPLFYFPNNTILWDDRTAVSDKEDTFKISLIDHKW